LRIDTIDLSSTQVRPTSALAQTSAMTTTPEAIAGATKK
jgi:hypothetical protein